MSCTKCQTLPRITDQGGDVVITCDVPELCTKIADTLTSENSFRRE